MATIKCIQTGSKGNGYAIITDDGILLLEAGVSFSAMKKAIEHRLGDVVACLISHQHGDHYKYLSGYSKAGIECYGAGMEKDVESGKISPIELMQPIELGSFTVIAFPLPHDVECYGYLIYHKEIGTILFATDCGEIPYYFTGVDYALIEANYSDKLLQESVNKGIYPAHLADRIRETHHSIDKCCDFIENRLNDSCHSICLIHLSDNNSNAEQFIKRVYLCRNIMAFNKVSVADNNSVILETRK